MPFMIRYTIKMAVEMTVLWRILSPNLSFEIESVLEPNKCNEKVMKDEGLLKFGSAFNLRSASF